jgi:alkaline phosphatase
VVRPSAIALAAVLSAGLASPAIAGRDDDPWFRSGRSAVAASSARIAGRPAAHNVILFIGDGMGPTTVTAARILEGQLRGESGEENWLSFERLPHVGLVKTYTTDHQVGDSAGTMTAIISGVKTKSGVLGVSDAIETGDASTVAAASVPTLIEEAEDRGLATGVVSTAEITHATPAACYAHTALRSWQADARLPQTALDAGVHDIALQLIEFAHGDGIDVVLGGGRSHFLPETARDPEDPALSGARKDGRNLLAEWTQRAQGGTVVHTAEALAALDPATVGAVLGTFDPGHMEWEADRAGDTGGEPSLAEMTAFAIRRLSREPKGFVLMVEAGRIDHGHHAGNAYRALTDTIALSDAVATALELTDRADTLVVVTADHAHTLTFAGYPARGNPILGVVQYAGEPTPDASGVPYTTLGYANGPGHRAASQSQPAGQKTFPHFHPHLESTGDAPARTAPVDSESPSYLQEAAVPLGSETHGGQDVAVYAGGPRSALFDGVHEQNVLYHAMVAALGWNDPAPQR